MDPVTTICGIERDEYRTEFEHRERASDRISPLIKKQADSFRKRFTCVECDSPGLADTSALVLRGFLGDIFSLKFFR